MLGTYHKYRISDNKIFYGNYNNINFISWHFYSILIKEQLFRYLIIGDEGI